ncbi:MAG: hypothetical protein D6813_15230 [Calditrichaeota bacterium]|nr:MAG: hypothetical protein D6813_15230 [Calditrichota bacterium]
MPVKTTYCCVLLFILMALCTSAAGQTDRYFMLSNVRARPLAMGGAFTSIEDDLAAINFNPAAFNLYQSEKPHRVTLFLNPVAPFVGLFQDTDLFKVGRAKFEDFLVTLSLFLKSIALSVNPFEFGILLGEENLYLPKFLESDEIFHTETFKNNLTHSFVAKLKLADQVSIGGAAFIVYGNDEKILNKQIRKIGLSYGILLKPEKKLNVGVVFFNLPDSLPKVRLPVERIVDESVNIGISYKAFPQTLFSLDVRNVVEEQSVVEREVHVGFEQIILSQFAFRAGFFNKKEGNFAVSAGIGIFDGNSLFSFDNDFDHKNFYINYAFIYEKAEPENVRWHLLSFFWRI